MLDLGHLQASLTPRTKMIALCNPNNPTGQAVSIDVMKDVVSMARSVNAYLLIDEVYRCEELFGEVQPSFYGLYDKMVVNSSVSKYLGVPGLRLGWTIGPKDYIDEVCKHRDYTTIAPNILSDFIVRKIFANPAKYNNIIKKNQEHLQQSWAVFEAWAKNFDEILSWTPPKAGAMVFMKYNLSITSRALMERILKEANILIVAGEDYNKEGYIRLGFGLPPQELAEALQKVGKILLDIQRENA